MSDLPAGTVTFLFTDVEGSTRLLQEIGNGYAEVLAEHRRLLRDVFARHDGFEVDTQGDAFFVAFAKASDALAAASAGRDALASSQIRVRMGIHTGEPLVTDEGYVGIDVHRAARIAAAGHGGQILVSQSTHDLAGAGELRDLGDHRLKDLSTPERIYQLGDGKFPPLKSLNATNLPLTPTPIVGRKKELADVLRLIRQDGVRLVTITGPGGIGKTRFALEAAGELAEHFTHGVWFVGLAPLRDPRLVLSAAASAIGAKEDVANHVGQDQVLFLFDNFEHVVDAAVDLAALLGACPRLAVLVTSRERLQIAGEHEYPLRPLAESPAVELFRQRALDVFPEFDGGYGELAEICRRLDSLPLAIELAAARTKLLAPAELLKRLDQRLPILTGGRRDADERHRTLRAAIAWSYDLLDESEQRLFVQLSVFAGSFDAEAAEAVTGTNLDTLEALIDKSLLRVTEAGRFFMLETIREFASEVSESFEDAAGLSRRHAEHYLSRVADSDAAFDEGRWNKLVARLEADHSNLRVAIAWAHAAGERELEVRLIAAMGLFWETRGFLDEAARHLETALSYADAEPRLRLALLGRAFPFAYQRGHLDEAAHLIEERLTLARALGDDERVVDSLRGLGGVQVELGALGKARELLEESVALAGRLPEGAGRAGILATADLGYVLLNEGDYDRAISLYEEALASPLAAGSQIAISCLENIAVAELKRGRTEHAARRAQEALVQAHELGFRGGTLYCFLVLAGVALLEQHFERAVTLVGVADTLSEELGQTLERNESQIREDVVFSARAALEENVFTASYAEGSALEIDAGVAYALAAVD